MKKIAETLALAAGGVCGYLFGELDGAFIGLVAMVILDYVTGVLAAFIKKELSSAIGFKGICRKVLLFVLVAAANIIDTVVLGASVLRTAIIFVFIANEGLSIIENAANLGIPIPKKLKDVLLQLKDENDGSPKEK